MQGHIVCPWSLRWRCRQLRHLIYVMRAFLLRLGIRIPAVDGGPISPAGGAKSPSSSHGSALPRGSRRAGSLRGPSRGLPWHFGDGSVPGAFRARHTLGSFPHRMHKTSAVVNSPGRGSEGCMLPQASSGPIASRGRCFFYRLLIRSAIATRVLLEIFTYSPRSLHRIHKLKWYSSYTFCSEGRSGLPGKHLHAPRHGPFSE